VCTLLCVCVGLTVCVRGPYCICACARTRLTACVHVCVCAGVGKTELAKALASFLFNTEDAMVGDLYLCVGEGHLCVCVHDGAARGLVDCAAS